jgi:hypothetical protein
MHKLILFLLISCAQYNVKVKKEADELANEVFDALKMSLGNFQACYQKELKLKNDFKGLIKLEFDLLFTGKPTRLRFDKKISPNLFNCLKGELSEIDFPSFSGKDYITFVQPLNFRPIKK